MAPPAANAAPTDIRRKTSAEADGQNGPADDRAPRPENRGATSGQAGSATYGPMVRRRRDAALRCEPLRDGRRDPWTFTAPAPSARSLAASRAAWWHLHDLGLLDGEGFVAGVLADLGGAA